MDYSDWNISAIHPTDELGLQSDTEENNEESSVEVSDVAIPGDLDKNYVEESFLDGASFVRLSPTFYTHVSFHIGRLIRYADHDKDA